MQQFFAFLEPLDLGASRMALALGGGSPLVEQTLRLLITSDLIKMWAPVLLLLYVWLRPEGRIGPRAELVLRGTLGLVLALAVDQAIQFGVERLRPRFALPDYPFPAYDSSWTDNITTSFPSDHAVVAFALTAAVMAGSRRLGLVAAFWSVAVICFPRLYYGFHWLTDLLGGAAIGVLGVLVMLRLPFPAAPAAWLRRFEGLSPALTVVALAVMSYELTTSFNNVRRLLRMAKDLGDAFGVI